MLCGDIENIRYVIMKHWAGYQVQLGNECVTSPAWWSLYLRQSFSAGMTELNLVARKHCWVEVYCWNQCHWHDLSHD